MHNIGVTLSGGYCDWMNEGKHIIFDKLTTSRSPLRIRRIRGAQPPLDFSQRNWAHPQNIFDRIVGYMCQ
jgi:hypothetical protein